MRITSQMMLSRYKSDVSDAYASMNKAMRHAYDYRAFDRPSDDPLAASQTFDVHWQMTLNDDYSSNISNLKGVTNTAESILQSVDKMLTSANSTTTLGAITITMSANNRSALADQLLSYRDQIVSEMNTKYSDNYLFSGTSSGSAPFELVKDPGGDVSKDKLYYRGVNVEDGTLKDGTPATVSLQALANDHTYVDIGLGMTTDASGNVNDQSAFDSSMPGIKYLGYGTNSNGTANNVVVLLSKVAGVLKSSSTESALSSSEMSLISTYTSTFTKTQDNLGNSQVQLGEKMTFLSDTANYLSDLKTNLAEKDNNVEYVDYTDAIEDYYSQLYCYNASLKVGSQILQQSLIDYIK